MQPDNFFNLIKSGMQPGAADAAKNVPRRGALPALVAVNWVSVANPLAAPGARRVGSGGGMPALRWLDLSRPALPEKPGRSAADQ